MCMLVSNQLPDALEPPNMENIWFKISGFCCTKLLALNAVSSLALVVHNLLTSGSYLDRSSPAVTADCPSFEKKMDHWASTLSAPQQWINAYISSILKWCWIKCRYISFCIFIATNFSVTNFTSIQILKVHTNETQLHLHIGILSITYS